MNATESNKVVQMPAQKNSETITISAMLATASRRFLHAAMLINQMRAYAEAGNLDDYWLVHEMLAEHLTVGGHAMTESNQMILRQLNIYAPQTGGVA